MSIMADIEDYGKPIWLLLIQWVFIFILISLSAMFSGLNLGLMSLDKLGLEVRKSMIPLKFTFILTTITSFFLQQVVIFSNKSMKNRKYARRIYPIRRRGNLLLCTILLGNVSVNAMLSILLADFTSGKLNFGIYYSIRKTKNNQCYPLFLQYKGFVGFLLSTFLIVIFGEIVPQASCSRYGLGKFSPHSGKYF